MRLSLQIAFVFLVLSYSTHIYRGIEPKIHPVVVNFNVAGADRVDNHVYLTGTMIKDRPCNFKGVVIYGVSPGRPAQLLNHKFLDTGGEQNQPRSRSTGFQTWGVWQVDLPENFDHGGLAIYSTHECWPFWLTESKLAKIPIPEAS